MTNPFTNPEELWAAIHRLYETSLNHDEALTRIERIQQEQAEVGRRTDERIDRLAAQLAILAGAVASHEQRLERLEGGK